MRAAGVRAFCAPPVSTSAEGTAMNPAAPTRSDRRFQIDALDGVRGLAVLLVFFSHCSNKGVSLVSNWDFSGIGKSGVWLFFLLSSFLLTYPFVAKGTESFRAASLGQYFWRRFLRVYPLYTIYLLLALATTPFLTRNMPQAATDHGRVGVPFALDASEFVQHLLLLQGKGVTWSILVEFKFYFLLPLLALAFVRLFEGNLLLSGLLTLNCLALAYFIWPDSVTNDPRLGPYLPIFLLGSFLALLHWHWKDQQWVKRPAVRAVIEGAGWAAMVCLVILIPSVASWLSGKTLDGNVFHTWFLTFCLLWSTVLLATIYGSGGLRSIFASPPLRFFGFISFSFYLLHVIVLNTFQQLEPHVVRLFPVLTPWFEDYPLLGWLIFAATTAVSYISYRVIEKPLSSVKLPLHVLEPTPRRLAANEP
jgi:peptidoglycan/LPS O-acetylase OafA/YrhL